MRTTLNIDDDIYLHARQIADAEHVAVGTIVSRIMRQGLQVAAPGGTDGQTPDNSGYVYVNGIPVIAADGRVITQALIDRIREEEGI